MKLRIAKWLRLFRHNFRIFYFRVESGMPGSRVDKDSLKNLRIGTKNWQTFMSQIIYNPKAISLGMVIKDGF